MNPSESGTLSPYPSKWLRCFSPTKPPFYLNNTFNDILTWMNISLKNLYDENVLRKYLNSIQNFQILSLFFNIVKF